MEKTKVLMLAAAIAAMVPAMASAGGGHHGGGHNNCSTQCGAKIDAQYCYDEGLDGSCEGDPPIEYRSSSLGIYLYTSEWYLVRVQLVGRDDGEPWNEQDEGETQFRGLASNETYILCAAGEEEEFTYPTAGSPNPSSRVSVVERPGSEGGQSRWCFKVRLRDCEDVVFARWFNAN